MSDVSSSLPHPPPVPRFDTLQGARHASPPPHPARHAAHQRTDSQSTTAPAIQDALARDFPDVANLNREELQALLEDDAYFDAYFHTELAQPVSLHEAVAHQIEQNLELARKSQELKPVLDELRSETKALFDEAVQLRHRSQLLAEAQHDAYRRFSQDVQLNRLRAASSMQEHLSEQLLHNWLSSPDDHEHSGDRNRTAEDLDLDQFLKRYREVRKVSHKRLGGLEKWEQGKVVWET